MKARTVFYCTDCGNETPKWAGRCASCGAWNTLVEAPVSSARQSAGKAGGRTNLLRSPPTLITELDSEAELRFSTGLSEFDRVLGGGAVRGSLVLVGGAPGIGKSTLLLQICGIISPEQKILYVTGEESNHQIKMRAKRLGVLNKNLYVLAETELESAVEAITDLSPDILIIDSIQTLYSGELNSAPGSVGQVKECTATIMRLAKAHGLTAFVVGHVNKEGAIAGPKVLEHMVDCVLYFEGERSTTNRILRAAKNRFGSTNEIGVFEMAESGLREVLNPSEMLLSGRPENAPGTCVTCVMEGTRPILAEIQALVTPSANNMTRRNTNGLDYNRVMMILAVLDKRGGLAVSGCDAYINVIGGLELDEPAADLSAILAIASSYFDKPIGHDVAAIGEIGLTGELRSVSALGQRLAEISRMGFKRCILSANAKSDVAAPDGLEIISVKSVREAIFAVLG